MVKLDSFSSFFVANWKLNGNLKFIDQFIDQLKIAEDNSKCIVICPTTIYLDYISHKKKNFFIGAQNVSQHIEGSFTGEISCESLTEFEIDFCIVGHSERRQIFHETNTDVKFKSFNLINNKIVPILCVGETFEEKNNGKTKEVIEKQLQEGLHDSCDSNNTIIAYEPVWAIGTGLTPSLKEIDMIHDYIRNHNKRFNKFKILYGGSVKASNSKGIVSLSNVDGALIGGASLKCDEFARIIQD